MNNRVSLLAGAAAGVLLAVGAATQAEAQPRAQRAAEADAILAQQAKQIEQLKAQVEALSERLLAQEKLQLQAQQAQAAAETARAGAAAQIQTIPTEVRAEVAQSTPKPASKPTSSWADSTQISGRMYFNLSNVEMKKDGAKVAPTGVGLDLKRFYLGVDHRFNDTFSGAITTDVQYNSAESLTQVFIKKAYLQAKLSDGAVVRLGSADMPWVPFAEDVYGYRFIENTVADRTKFATSADWGAHVSGKLLDGHVGYAFSAVNGAGFKNPVRSKTMDFEGRVNLNVSKAVLAVGGYSGKLGKEVQGGPATPHTAERVNALAGWVDSRYRLGVEYFAASNWNTVTSAVADKSDGYSVFGSFNFTPQISAFGRIDQVRPSRDLKPKVRERYWNAGLNWEPTKIVDLALVYKRDKVDNGVLSTSSGSIGGLIDGTYDEIGLFGQFRW